MTTPDIETLKQINRSGFPFQLRIEHEILLTKQQHNWAVASREHAWASGSSSGFIDLVLKHEIHTTYRLVLECKRNKAQDMRLLRWVFLLPDQKPQITNLASCFEVEMRERVGQIDGSGMYDIRVWDNVAVTPGSLQSEFCILHSDEEKRQSILERRAADLLESIEGLAQEEVCVEKSVGGVAHARLFIFPVIVTNAELTVCRFDSQNVKLSDGTIDVGDVELTSVPFIRFRKSLATSFPSGMFYYLDAANKARERTVFIVNAESLPSFLSNWKVNALHEGQFASQRLLSQ